VIDISKKSPTSREAIVAGSVFLSHRAILAIKKGKLPKGDCLDAARFAGIIAAKKTSELIPLCHPIQIDFVDIEFSIGKNEIKVRTTVKGFAKTGVEMEALTATSVACLTIYDMCKAMDRDIVISDIKLIKKTGGKSGAYIRL